MAAPMEETTRSASDHEHGESDYVDVESAQRVSADQLIDRKGDANRQEQRLQQHMLLLAAPPVADSLHQKVRSEAGDACSRDQREGHARQDAETEAGNKRCDTTNRRSNPPACYNRTAKADLSPRNAIEPCHELGVVFRDSRMPDEMLVRRDSIMSLIPFIMYHGNLLGDSNTIRLGQIASENTRSRPDLRRKRKNCAL